jgi:conjugal transfer pilus assembly protein TraE
MKEKLQHLRLQDLLRHRNYLTFIASGLLGSNLLMTFALCTQSERVVLVPPHLTGATWVERSKVSPQYLEEMALFFGSILLNKTPQSASISMNSCFVMQKQVALVCSSTNFEKKKRDIKKVGLAPHFIPKRLLFGRRTYKWISLARWSVMSVKSAFSSVKRPTASLFFCSWAIAHHLL